MRRFKRQWRLFRDVSLPCGSKLSVSRRQSVAPWRARQVHLYCQPGALPGVAWRGVAQRGVGLRRDATINRAVLKTWPAILLRRWVGRCSAMATRRMRAK